MADGRIPTANKRLVTGARGVDGRPIGTAIRGDPNFKSIGMVTSDTLNIVNRPATKQEHGLVGLKTKGQTHERQIYDRNYYLTQLVNKSNEMAREIEKFTKQTEEITKDNQAFFTLEKKYETLTKEVRKLEGELADYNLTFDKLRAGARPEDIQNMYEHVRMSNERLRAQLDEFFIERKTQEDQIQAFEAQLNEIHQAAELKINELDPDQRADYESMINENRQLIVNINAQRNELEELNQILSQADAKLRMDDKKQKYKILKEQVSTLEKKKEELEIQTNENNLSFPEARDRLLARVKEDNNYIIAVDKKIKDTKRIIENYEKQLKDMKMDLEEKKSEEQEKQKYEVIYQRDKEMTEFIDTFEENRKNEMQLINRTEHNIVEVLEQASKILLMNTELPNKEQFLQLQNEFAHKKTHQENAEVTLQRLKLEYEQRANEIKNFDQFEERMTTEAQTLQEKLAKMEDEMKNKFNRINEYRKESEDKRNKLLKNREALGQQLQKIKEELNSVNLDHERKKQKLSLHDQFKNLSGLEKTFGQNEGQICNLRTFIKSRAVDMDYKNLIGECNTMADSLNKMLLQQYGGK